MSGGNLGPKVVFVCEELGKSAITALERLERVGYLNASTCAGIHGNQDLAFAREVLRKHRKARESALSTNPQPTQLQLSQALRALAQHCDGADEAMLHTVADIMDSTIKPVGEVFTMEALVPGGDVRHHVTLYQPLPCGTQLYSGPVTTMPAL